MRGLLPLVLLLPLISTPLEAQCVTPGHAPYPNVGAIQLVPSGWPAGLSSAVASGAAMWNDPGCNTNGSGFPRFQFQAAGAGRTINVEYVQGINLERPQDCGFFEGNAIMIFSHFRPNGTGPYTSCGDVGILGETVAHELGHVLGLQDQLGSGCYGWIMSQVVFNTNGTIRHRTIQGAECQTADEINEELQSQNEQCSQSCWTACKDAVCPTKPFDPNDSGTPILVDLDRNGFHLTGLADPVHFDLHADGQPDATSWTAAGALDAFLCLDRNRNGVIDDGRELFGDATPLSTGGTAPNGYIALAEYDSRFYQGNQDGFISSADAVFRDLCLWIDANHDGLSQPWELSGLAARSITRLGYKHVRSEYRDPYGNWFRFLGKAWKRDLLGGEQVLSTVDVFFVVAVP